jgi:hypothetical protein
MGNDLGGKDLDHLGSVERGSIPVEIAGHGAVTIGLEERWRRLPAWRGDRRTAGGEGAP